LISEIRNRQQNSQLIGKLIPRKSQKLEQESNWRLVVLNWLQTDSHLCLLTWMEADPLPDQQH